MFVLDDFHPPLEFWPEERRPQGRTWPHPQAGPRFRIGRLSIPKTTYMVVEHFKNHDPVPVYRRFRDRGRMAPEGLVYVSSWIDDKLERCYQLMETHGLHSTAELVHFAIKHGIVAI